MARALRLKPLIFSFEKFDGKTIRDVKGTGLNGIQIQDKIQAWEYPYMPPLRDYMFGSLLLDAVEDHRFINVEV